MSSVASQLQPLVTALLNEPKVRIEFWDGSSVGPDTAERLRINSPTALQYILWAPGDLGLGRAFVAGEIDASGDVIDLIISLSSANTSSTALAKVTPSILKSAKSLGLLSSPPPIPEIEFVPPKWGIHSLKGDASAVSHHYDVSNEFYEYLLGPAMTYTCARFSDPAMTLEQAQANKHDNICRKLGLDVEPGQRLLDVGCGWGSMAIYAAKTYRAEVVGITISQEQADLAQKRVVEAGVSDLVDIRMQDYRHLDGERFDAISSIGMSEQVGKGNLTTYFQGLADCLGPGGRLLNHAISSIGGSKLSSRSFMYRYIFPGGELIDLGAGIESMQDAGFEIRDVESLREHYAQTLRNWLANLETNWDAAVELVGIQRARAWRLYIAASAVGFIDAGLNLHQVLGVVNSPTGESGMPRSRPV